MAALSGQQAIAAAGTAEALGSQLINGPLMVKALIANTNLMYIGSDGAGDVTSANGLQLAAGDVVVFDFVGDLATLWLDSAVNGEAVSWLVLQV